MKRANGEGSLYHHKDGRASPWEASLTYRDGLGNLHRLRSSLKTREEADRALTKMKHERDGGIALAGPNPTLKEYLVGWLRESVAVSVDPKTLEGLSVRTRRNIHATLKRALKQAVAWGELASSPAEMVDPPKGLAEDEAEEEMRALANAQAIQLFAAAEDVEDRFRHLYVMAVRTGLRQGEILALRWSDLSLESDPPALSLKRSLAQKIGGGHYYTPTKRKRQRRTIAILSEAADALRAQRELQEQEKAAAGERWQENGLVFPSTIGTPMSARNLYRRHFKPLIRSAGLPDISFHDLRHTFA